eukprot:3442127-Pyramimonas_sp.AAC.1
MTISTPAPTPTPYHQMVLNPSIGQISCKLKVAISAPNTCSGYCNRQSGFTRKPVRRVRGGYGGASKEKVKANGVAVG